MFRLKDFQQSIKIAYRYSVKFKKKTYKLMSSILYIQEKLCRGSDFPVDYLDICREIDNVDHRLKKYFFFSPEYFFF